MSEDVLDDFPPSFPTRFRGYDRGAVDHELHELRIALDYARAERDRAVARALALETGAPGGPTSASAAVQWLIESAEQDARRIRAESEEETRAVAGRAEELLRRRVELVDEAQQQADACRAQATEEARLIVHEALEKAAVLLRGLQESEVSLQEMFASGALSHRMPPPRSPGEPSHGQHASVPQTAPDSVIDVAAGQQIVPQQAVGDSPAQHAAAENRIPGGTTWS